MGLKDQSLQWGLEGLCFVPGHVIMVDKPG